MPCSVRRRARVGKRSRLSGTQKRPFWGASCGGERGIHYGPEGLRSARIARLPVPVRQPTGLSLSGHSGSQRFSDFESLSLSIKKRPFWALQWRRERDSNPRYWFTQYTRLAGEPDRPLRHLSSNLRCYLNKACRARELARGILLPQDGYTGGVAERFKAPVLKTDVGQLTAGSNPAPSAIQDVSTRLSGIQILRCGPVGPCQRASVSHHHLLSGPFYTLDGSLPV